MILKTSDIFGDVAIQIRSDKFETNSLKSKASDDLSVKGNQL